MEKPQKFNVDFTQLASFFFSRKLINRNAFVIVTANRNKSRPHLMKLKALLHREERARNSATVESLVIIYS